MPRLEKQNGPVAKSRDKKKMKDISGRYNYTRHCGYGYVVGGRLSAFVAHFTYLSK